MGTGGGRVGNRRGREGKGGHDGRTGAGEWKGDRRWN